MNTLALTFNNIKLTPVQHNNQIWLTASQLATALGYSRTDKISQIYQRNQDEFNDSMTAVLRDPQIEVLGESKGLQRTYRIFSLRGCHLIAMFASTIIAKDFRKWVLDILDQHTAPIVEPVITPEPPPVEYITYQMEGELKRIVYQLSRTALCDGGWRHGIYSRLRTATGSKSPNKYELKHLPMIANELYQIMAITKAMKEITHDFEAKVLKTIIREGKDLTDLEPLIKETQAEQQKLLSDLSSGFIAKYQAKLEKYELSEIESLTA